MQKQAIKRMKSAISNIFFLEKWSLRGAKIGSNIILNMEEGARIKVSCVIEPVFSKTHHDKAIVLQKSPI